MFAELWVPALRSSHSASKTRVNALMHAAPRPGHDTSQRGVDGLGVFLFEPRDQFGGGQHLGDTADALA
ncbi:hypothetical protein SAMN05443247_00374 [Bradyrhizobium erythrophlei]|jgi:hypothetical protein|nr:hypothetical protein SAMN05443247_00374 [Bradyrhizobium erythrophlei]